MLADTFSSETLGSVIGSVMISHTIGFTLGPLIGGFLYELGGMTAPFYVCALFALVIFIGTLWIDEPMKDQAREPLLPCKPKKRSEFIYLLSNYRIVTCIICTFVTAAGLSGIEPALPIYLKEKYHVSTATIGGKYIKTYVFVMSCLHTR